MVPLPKSAIRFFVFSFPHIFKPNPKIIAHINIPKYWPLDTNSIGLEIDVITILDSTSQRFVVAVEVDVVFNWILTGNKILIITAIIAAKNVPDKYKIITVLNLDPIPLPALDIEEETKKNTKIGATALRELTNNVPRKPKKVQFGTKIPNIVPMIKPIIIFNMRLVSVHFLKILPYYTLFHSLNTFIFLFIN